MKTLEQGQETIDKICEELRKQTLEPAIKKAEEILQEAEKFREQKIHEAKKEAEEILQAAKREVERERRVFESSLAGAAKLSLEKLRQDILQHFFNPSLESLIVAELVNPEVIARIIDTLVRAIEKEGFASNLQVEIPKAVSAREVTALIAKDLLDKFEGKSVQVGSFKGGVKVKISDQKMTIDMSDQAIFELLAPFVTKDFRNFIFQS